MSNEVQVLVVGAGPTGLVAAITLAQKGVNVQIVDASQSSNKFGARASVVHSHTLEVLDTLGVATEIIERGIKCDTLHFRTTEQHTLVKVDLSLIAKYTRFPFSVLISQGDVEEILQKQLEAHNLHIQRGKELTGIKKIHQNNKVEFLFADDTTIVTQYIIGADGAHSTVRHLVGIDFINPLTGASYDDPNDPEPFQMALADVYLEEPLPEIVFRNQPTFLTESYILLIPLPSPSDPKKLMWRVGLGVPSGSGEIPHNPPLEYLQREINKRNSFSVPIKISSVLNSSRYRVRAALADTYTAKIGSAHVLLIGDAAHIHSPVGGQGMNLGICDAISAAHSIHAHMNSDDLKRDTIFFTYGKKRREVGERVIGFTMTETRILAFGAGSKWKTALRNAIVKALMSFRFIRRMAAWGLSGLINRSDDL